MKQNMFLKYFMSIFLIKKYEELWTEELTPEEISKTNKFIDENTFLKKAIDLFGTNVEVKII